MKLLWYNLVDNLSRCVHIHYCYYVIHHCLQPIRVNAIKIFIKNIAILFKHFFQGIIKFVI